MERMKELEKRLLHCGVKAKVVTDGKGNINIQYSDGTTWKQIDKAWECIDNKRRNKS